MIRPTNVNVTSSEMKGRIGYGAEWHCRFDALFNHHSTLHAIAKTTTTTTTMQGQN